MALPIPPNWDWLDGTGVLDQPAAQILTDALNARLGTAYAREDLEFETPVPVDVPDSYVNTEVNVHLPAGQNPATLKLRYQRLDLSTLFQNQICEVAFDPAFHTNIPDVAVSLGEQFSIRFDPEDFVEQGLPDASLPAVLTATASASSLGYVGSVEITLTSNEGGSD